jgi:hypothetical protein
MYRQFGNSRDFKTLASRVVMISVCLLVTYIGTTDREKDELPKEMLGPEFIAPDNSIGAKEWPWKFTRYDEFYLPRVQSDWSVFSIRHRDPKRHVISIRVWGFESTIYKKPVDFMIVEPLTLQRFESSFDQNCCFRPAVSDIAAEFMGFGGRGSEGALQLEFDSGEKVTIGVSKLGFFLGCFEGSMRNVFYGPRLAKELTVAIKERSDRALSDDLVSALSGANVTGDADEHKNEEMLHR